jgi:DNA-binding NtrC family response regulator
MTAIKNILVVEADESIRKALKTLLEQYKYRVKEANSIKTCREKYDLDTFDLIISDLRLPDAPGTDLIKSTTTPVLIMTSYSSIRSAIDTIKMGAADYLAKQANNDEIIEAVAKLLLERENIYSVPADDHNHEPPVKGMVGRCPQMMEMFRRIRKVAQTNSTVLVNGESGTGKELVAKAIHDLSTRESQEMISVNCAAIPENLIESELFGHEKGAFTGATATRTGLVEAANKSTLFLDEIGELPLEAQARLLRVLQENEIRKVGSVQSTKVDVRLVAATHRDLKQLVIDGDFREDLYYRINVMTLLIPPLRERGNDILELADVKLKRTCDRLKAPLLRFGKDASKAIASYKWPGNVRELENAIERAVVLAEGEEIGEDLLAIEGDLTNEISTIDPEVYIEDPDADELSLEEYFQRFVLSHQDSLNETQLAKKLGISRKCLWERRQKFGIPRKKKEAI